MTVVGRNLLALAVLVAAILRGDLLHPSPLYSLWLPLLGLAAFIYLTTRLLARGGRGGSADGCTTGDGYGCSDSDSGSCGGDGGGGGD